MDEHLPRKPDPELDKVIHPRGAKSFYSLGSGSVHGFKWLTDYVHDDSGLLTVTLDAFGNALRMTECAVSLFEADLLGRNPTRGGPATIRQDWRRRSQHGRRGIGELTTLLPSARKAPVFGTPGSASSIQRPVGPDLRSTSSLGGRGSPIRGGGWTPASGRSVHIECPL